MLRLTGMILAFAALTGPATASASTWTAWNGEAHVELEGEQSVEQTFEGPLSFVVPGVGTVECEARLTLVAEGPASGRVTELRTTTATCIGKGFPGSCVLTDSDNAPWDAALGEGDIEVTVPSGEMELYFDFTCIADIAVKFTSITLTPTLDEAGTITALGFSFTRTPDAASELSIGPLSPVGEELILGLV